MNGAKFKIDGSAVTNQQLLYGWKKELVQYRFGSISTIHAIVTQWAQKFVKILILGSMIRKNLFRTKLLTKICENCRLTDSQSMIEKKNISDKNANKNLQKLQT